LTTYIWTDGGFQREEISGKVDISNNQHGFFRPLIIPVDGAAANKRWIHAAALPEGVSSW